MYNNIGEKLISVGKVTCILGIAASVISCFAMCGAGMPGQGVGVLLGGALASWILSLPFVGFGTVIMEIQKQSRQNQRILEMLVRVQDALEK